MIEFDLRPEYDFTHGARGKHHQAYRAGTNVVFLEPDVAEVFTDSASVNQALRLLVQLARDRVPRQRRPDLALQPARRAESRGKRTRKSRLPQD